MRNVSFVLILTFNSLYKLKIAYIPHPPKKIKLLNKYIYIYIKQKRFTFKLLKSQFWKTLDAYKFLDVEKILQCLKLKITN